MSNTAATQEAIAPHPLLGIEGMLHEWFVSHDPAGMSAIAAATLIAFAMLS